MSKPECRESRVVPFDANGRAWAGAAVGVLRSADIGTALDKQARLLPFERQRPPGSLARESVASSVGSSVGAVWGSVADVRAAVRPPLAACSGNAEIVKRVFSSEMRALELDAEALRKRVWLQEKLIRGFCAREVQRGDGRCD